MRTIKEHTHWGIWITVIILGIVVLSNHNPFSTSEPPQNNEINENKISKVVFEFDDEYFRVYDEYSILDDYFNKTIELPPGHIKNIEYILKNNENFTTFCIEHFMRYIDVSLTKTNIPIELSVTDFKYKVDCYDISGLNEVRDYLLVEQSYSDTEDSIIKLSLWKEE